MKADPRFGRIYEFRLLVHAYRDKQLFADIVAIPVRLVDFDSLDCRLIYEVLMQHFRTHKELLPMPLLTSEVTTAMQARGGKYETLVSEMDYAGIAELLEAMAWTPAADLSTAWVRDQIKDFLWNARLAQIDAGGGTATSRALEVIKANQELSTVSRDATVFRSIGESYGRTVYSGPRLGTGIHHIDRYIYGGLVPGEFGTIVAATGVGKTTFQLNMAVAAAYHGFYSLVITLENPYDMLDLRTHAMLSHVPTSEFYKDPMLLDENVRRRMMFIREPSFNLAERVCILDYSKEVHTVMDIEAAIVKWRNELAAKGVKPEKCLLVCVDWAEKISPLGVPGIPKNAGVHDVLKAICSELARIARRQQIIGWTALQANREGSSREVLEIKHTATGYGAQWDVDLALAISVINKNNTSVGAPSLLLDADRVTTEVLDRDLYVSVLKCRSVPIVGRHTQIYQGSTMRFWKDVNAFSKVNKAAQECNDVEAFVNMMRM